jgi:hypothetical protein
MKSSNHKKNLINLTSHLLSKIWIKMGFDAEIDNSERNGVVDNLQEEIICSICFCIFEVFCFFFGGVYFDFYDSKQL